MIERQKAQVLPVIATPAGEVIAGWIFVEAARQKGIKQLRVIVVDGMSEVERLEYSIACKRLLECGSWDGGLMAAALMAFEQEIEDFAVDLLGFEPGELDRIARH